MVLHNKEKVKNGVLPAGVSYFAGESFPDVWCVYPWDAKVCMHVECVRVCMYVCAVCLAQSTCTCRFYVYICVCVCVSRMCPDMERFMFLSCVHVYVCLCLCMYVICVSLGFKMCWCSGHVSQYAFVCLYRCALVCMFVCVRVCISVCALSHCVCVIMVQNHELRM